ncbi:MAG: hypothetical protein MAG431_01730 [Chloroflexi bacterium]|nr:hypothetical protein [Chloroflexota bacterium]
MPASKHTPFTLSIAGLRVAISCQPKTLNQKLQERYQVFLSEENAHLRAQIHLSGDLRPHPLLERGTRFEGDILHFTAPGFQGEIAPQRNMAHLQLSAAAPIEEIDYFMRVIYALLAFEAGGFLFHAAGIVREERAHLFFGPSGSGKTTVSRLSADDLLLNDDLLVLLPDRDGWETHGTPFWNPSQAPPARGREHAPVTALFRLVQDKTVYLQKMNPAQALAEITGSVPIIPLSTQYLPTLLTRLETMLSATPVYYLHFLPDDSFWEVIRETGIREQGIRKSGIR